MSEKDDCMIREGGKRGLMLEKLPHSQARIKYSNIRHSAVIYVDMHASRARLQETLLFVDSLILDPHLPCEYTKVSAGIGSSMRCHEWNDGLRPAPAEHQ